MKHGRESAFSENRSTGTARTSGVFAYLPVRTVRIPYHLAESLCVRAACSIAKLIVRTVQFGSAEPFLPAYPVPIEPNNRGVPRCSALVETENTMSHSTYKPTPKLRRAPQPPLSYAGAVPDSDRAKRPPLSETSATGPELSPGDRVEGLGNFGKPTGEFGTVERANEDDAVVKWDDDGRMRIHQPSLKKI